MSSQAVCGDSIDTPPRHHNSSSVPGIQASKTPMKKKSKVTLSIEIEEKKPWDLLWSSVLRPKTKKEESCLCKTGEQAALLPAPLIRLCTLVDI